MNYWLNGDGLGDADGRSGKAVPVRTGFWNERVAILLRSANGTPTLRLWSAQEDT